MSEYRWIERKFEAALLVAVGRLADLEIGARVGISDRQLRRWKHRPEFQLASKEPAYLIPVPERG
jgi:hypothetical protein